MQSSLFSLLVLLASRVLCASGHVPHHHNDEHYTLEVYNDEGCTGQPQRYTQDSKCTPCMENNPICTAEATHFEFQVNDPFLHIILFKNSSSCTSGSKLQSGGSWVYQHDRTCVPISRLGSTEGFVTWRGHSSSADMTDDEVAIAVLGSLTGVFVILFIVFLVLYLMKERCCPCHSGGYDQLTTDHEWARST